MRYRWFLKLTVRVIGQFVVKMYIVFCLVWFFFWGGAEGDTLRSNNNNLYGVIPADPFIIDHPIK